MTFHVFGFPHRFICDWAREGSTTCDYKELPADRTAWLLVLMPQFNHLQTATNTMLNTVQVSQPAVRNAVQDVTGVELVPGTELMDDGQYLET